MDDCDLLLAWRNDPVTRQASRREDAVGREDHVRWLRAVLADPQRQLYIAEEEGRPVGTVRADLSDGVYEISWTVAPSARGAGVGKRMVALLVEQFTGPLRAEVKVGNPASVRIAEATGFRLQSKAEGILHYFRPAAA